jgi:hypothetical protein
MRQILLFLLANFSLGLLTSTTIQAQTASSKASSEVVSSPAREFWKRLTAHCGKAYEGRLADGINQPDFEGKRLVMHVRYCDATTIQIPFFVGDDRSRTWVLTYDEATDRIKLKHDHRHEDGTPDQVTQYGGTSSNAGFPHLQFFPADEETAKLIDYASANVWWITVDEKEFSYNLRRLGTERLVTVIFDLTKNVTPPPTPWGWE